MKAFKVPFAYDANNNIIEIAAAEKGKEYKCRCGGTLRVKGGNVISKHFWHYNSEQLRCSLESVVHKAYKLVFEQVQAIRLPYKIDGVNTLVFDRVEIEKEIDYKVRPDAIAYIGNKKYLIEFAKSSYVKANKLAKIQKANLFCIEVDIRKNIGSLRDIRKHLLNESEYKHILHIPHYEPMQQQREAFAAAYTKQKTKTSKTLRYCKEVLKHFELSDKKELQINLPFNKVIPKKDKKDVDYYQNSGGNFHTRAFVQEVNGKKEVAIRIQLRGNVDIDTKETLTAAEVVAELKPILEQSKITNYEFR